MTQKKKTSKNNEKNKALTAEEIAEKYTVKELKKILKENDMSVSGKKQDLVERVLPILNDDAGETSDEDMPNDTELKEKTFKVKKVVYPQTEDSESGDDEDLPSQDKNDALTSALSIFGIKYDELPIEDKTIAGDNTNLNIQGSTQNGLSMSDYTMSLTAGSDSSNVDFKISIPEISYSNFENTIFTLKNIDLSILPSSDPQSLDLSAIIDSLEIITESNYINLKGLNLLFKALPDENGVHLDIDIDSFIYPNFYDGSISLENLGLDMSIGVDGQSLNISVNLPKLTLLNKDYRVSLSDLNLNITLPDLELSNLDLSILMPDFHYTNFDDVYIDMENVDVSLEPITDSSSANVIIRMDALDAAGLDSFDELFPMLNINSVNFKNPTDDSESPITMTASMALLDISKIGLSGLASLLSSGFNLDTYTSNMPNQYKDSIEVNAVDISSTEVSDSDESGFDLVSVFENCDYSGLDAIKLDLTKIIDSAGIDLLDFGIDLSGYDLSNISVSDLIGELTKSEFIMTAISAISKLSSIDFDNLDFDGLIVSFDTENFDISGLLESLNLGELDIAGIIDMFTKSNVDWDGIFKNCDYSCLDAIKIDLTKLIDSLGIDLSELGIDLGDCDLSAISLSEIIDILSKLDLDMNTISTILKLFGLDLDNIDLKGLISSFDTENFDISGLLESLNLSGSDIAGIIDMFTNSDVDWDGIFKNCDYSSLDGMVLDLTGLIDSAGIDVSDLGIDMSDYDLSAISLPELIDILSNPDLDMSAITSKLESSNPELNNIDLNSLISSFDAENFDISGILESLNLGDLDISALVDMFTNSDIDWDSIFENCDYSCLDAIKLDLTGLIDSLGIDLSDLGIDLGDCDLSDISLSELIDILCNVDLDMDTVTALLKLFGLELDDLDLKGLISSFDAENFDMSSLLESLNLGDLDIGGIIDMFSNSDIDWDSIFENCDYSCLDAIKLDLTKLLDSAGIDLSDFGIDVSDYDLSEISLSELIDAITKSEFIMTAITAISKLFSIDLDELDWDGLVSSFDAENFDMSGLLESLNLGDMDMPGIFGNFDASGFDLTEFLNSTLGLMISTTFPEAVQDYDTELICQTKVFTLESLNKLFDMTFVNGHLKVCIDDELVFEGDTTDDLTQEIFEIIDKYLGKHEITVEFSDSKGKTNNYNEKIVVE